jgi:FtsP/CotA-like multicopper oxidase with cupredoxin domain
LVSVAALPATAQSFRVQCPTSTITHPTAANNNSEPAYNGATTFATSTQGYLAPASNVNGAIKCQQISGGDGYATMGDGTQTYTFSFGPLSGLADIANGLPGTQFPGVFNTLYPGGTPLKPGDPATTGPGFTYNGAVGLVPDLDNGGVIDGHVDPRPIMDIAVMNGNIPAPLMAIDEDDEFFLTLTNVGQIMRPDLFEQHTVHFHGYPNASSFYDGVPDASVAINIGGSFTYYYLAPDAGTYFWHCHITPPEHLQMGMVGQLYVRPRQNRVAVNASLLAALQKQQQDPRTACNSAADILCSNPLPRFPPPSVAQGLRAPSGNYAYNDGDGSTYYDVEYPLQIHGFDPNFHFVGMTFNPEAFADMKDKYFLLNGRSYPDTVTAGPLQTVSADGANHFAQPLPAIVNIPAGKKALLRISDLDVSEYQTLASLGIPMKVIALNAKLLRDQGGNNMYYTTNSITLAGGESLDVILDASDTTKYPAGSVFYLYTPNLDHLSNDAENFGGLMTEVRIN